LVQHEAETHHQITILTVPSLEGDPIEDFSLRVAEAWKLGDKKEDNGVLLLVAKEDRKMRIEVGYGLEGDIPDALAGRIIQNVMVPHFRKGDFSGGITAATNLLMDASRGKKVEIEGGGASSKSSPGGGGRFIVLVLLFLLFSFGSRSGLLFGLLALGASGGRHRSGFGGGGFGGGGFGGGGFSGGGGGFGGGGASGSW
jgi:uncharacterized protein